MHTPQNNGKGSMCIVYYLVVYIYTYIVGVDFVSIIDYMILIVGKKRKIIK